MQALGNAMLKTPKGTEIFDRMVADKRRIHVHIASKLGGESDQRILGRLAGRADGEILPGNVFTKIINGEALTEEDTEKGFSFDPKTGLYDKTAEWDETHILLSEEGLIIGAGVIESFGETPERAADRSMLRMGGEEAAHTLQFQVEFYPAKKDPSNSNRYVPNEDAPLIDYNDRRHEKWAKGAARQMDQEYRDGKKP